MSRTWNLLRSECSTVDYIDRVEVSWFVGCPEEVS